MTLDSQVWFRAMRHAWNRRGRNRCDGNPQVKVVDPPNLRFNDAKSFSGGRVHRINANADRWIHSMREDGSGISCSIKGAASLKLSAQIISCAILCLVKSGTLSLITDLQRAIKA